jgi:murein L,D-transpeptidase YafK
MGETYQALDSYRICNYSGGLGPKKRQGDFKSPGSITFSSQLKPDSRFYKAINIGFPNAYDRAHGYEGKYLMIHGACVSSAATHDRPALMRFSSSSPAR